MESCTDFTGPTPETLKAVAFIIERATLGLVGLRELLSECEDDKIGTPAGLALERVVQMLDGCLGALDGTGQPHIGSFVPDDDISDIIARLQTE